MDIRRFLKIAGKVALVSVPIILGFIGFSDLYKDLGSRLYHTITRRGRFLVASQSGI